MDRLPKFVATRPFHESNSISQGNEGGLDRTSRGKCLILCLKFKYIVNIYCKYFEFLPPIERELDRRSHGGLIFTLYFFECTIYKYFEFLLQESKEPGLEDLEDV